MFPVIADTSLEVAGAYNVLLEEGTALRGTFIIDPSTGSCGTSR